MTRTILRSAMLLVLVTSAALTVAAQAPAQPNPAQPAVQPPPGQQPYPAQPPPAQPPPPQGYQQQPYPAQPPPGQPYAAQTWQPLPPASPPASPPFGEQGQIILSADRLFGLSFWWSKLETDGGITSSANGTAINLLWGDSQDVTIYSIPRFGFDYVIVPNLSLGGSFGFIHRSASGELSNGTASISVDLPSRNAFAISPRAGYILAISPMIAFWLRGGITYFTDSVEETDQGPPAATVTTSANGFALDLEPQLVILPVPHFGLTVGVAGDIGLGGNWKSETKSGGSVVTTELTSKVTNVSVTFGLLGHI